MSRYDGLIIPRSYNEYINKSDPLTLAQALQQNNVLSAAVAAGDNKAVKSGAVATALATYRRMNLQNPGANFVYRYILLQPTAQSYEKNAEFTFNIFIWRSGISSSKIIKVDFASSYDANEGQCIVQCGIRADQNSVEFAKIVKLTYNNVEYFALKVYVYEYSQTTIYYNQSIPRYTSDLLYKILTSEEVTEGATVPFTTMFLNGEKIVTETYTKITAAGNASVSLSGITFNELILEIALNNQYASFTFNILKDMLTTSVKYFRDGYYSSAASGLCTVSARTTEISLTTLLINGTDEKANATINVYYR
jgi:hypothetical protein